MNIIETKDLTKNFGSFTAVDRVSLHVREGEIYGFLGLNGAGKTTTIRLLLGMIKPDTGSIRIFEKKPQQASDIWNKIGYMVETPFSYPNLTVLENLEVFYRLRGLKDRSHINSIIQTLHLEPYANKKSKHLSLGNNQRLGLAKALLHKPKLLLLDKPINGLDPAGIVEIREYLINLAQNEGTTIFLSSHILSEIAKVASRIGIVNQGALVKELNTSELEHQTLKKIVVSTQNNPFALDVLKKSGFAFSNGEEGMIVSTETNAINSPEIIATQLVNANIPPRMLQIFEEDLETYFLRIIEN